MTLEESVSECHEGRNQNEKYAKTKLLSLVVSFLYANKLIYASFVKSYRG